MLVTLTELKDYLDVNGSSEDATLQTLLDAAHEFADSLTDRDLRSDSYSHQFSGGGKHELQTREFPVSSVVQVAIDPNWVFGSAESATSYFINDESTIIRNLVWPQGIRNIKIDYVAGYSLATVPLDLKQAIILTAEHFYRTRADQRLGVQSRSKVSENINYFDGVPKLITDMYKPHTRPEYLKSRIARL